MWSFSYYWRSSSRYGKALYVTHWPIQEAARAVNNFAIVGRLTGGLYLCVNGKKINAFNILKEIVSQFNNRCLIPQGVPFALPVRRKRRYQRFAWLLALVFPAQNKKRTPHKI
jgi:hypothetical protein